MNKLAILAAAAPLALLAACGDADNEEVAMEEDTMAADTMANDTATTTPAGTGMATAQADAGDFSGVYSFASDDGEETAVRINTADTSYEYVGSDGEVRRGTYTWAPDGYRMQVSDWYGTPAYFVISDGELVKLANDNEVDNSMTVEGERYSRANEGDAVFSRFPEPGSSVAPE